MLHTGSIKVMCCVHTGRHIESAVAPIFSTICVQAVRLIVHACACSSVSTRSRLVSYYSTVQTIRIQHHPAILHSTVFQNNQNIPQHTPTRTNPSPQRSTPHVTHPPPHHQPSSPNQASPQHLTLPHCNPPHRTPPHRSTPLHKAPDYISLISTIRKPGDSGLQH